MGTMFDHALSFWPMNSKSALELIQIQSKSAELRFKHQEKNVE